MLQLGNWQPKGQKNILESSSSIEVDALNYPSPSPGFDESILEAEQVEF